MVAHRSESWDACCILLALFLLTGSLTVEFEEIVRPDLENRLNYKEAGSLPPSRASSFSFTRTINGGAPQELVRPMDDEMAQWLVTRIANLTGHTESVKTIGFSSDGKYLATATGGFDRTVLVWETSTWDNITQVVIPYPEKMPEPNKEGITGDFRQAVFNPDGGDLITVHSFDEVGADDWLKLGQAISADGTLLATASWENRVTVWDTSSWTRIKDIPEENDELRSYASREYLAFSPDGSTLAVGLKDGSIQLLDTTSWEQKAMMEGHADQVVMVIFATDGKRLVSLAKDKTVKVWDTTTWKEEVSLGFVTTPQHVAFDPGGRFISITRFVDTIILNTTSWEPVLWISLLPPVAFSPDGRYLAGEPFLDPDLLYGTVIVLDFASAMDNLEGRTQAFRDLALKACLSAYTYDPEVVHNMTCRKKEVGKAGPAFDHPEYDYHGGKAEGMFEQRIAIPHVTHVYNAHMGLGDMLLVEKYVDPRPFKELIAVLKQVGTFTHTIRMPGTIVSTDIGEIRDGRVVIDLLEDEAYPSIIQAVLDGKRGTGTPLRIESRTELPCSLHIDVREDGTSYEVSLGTGDLAGMDICTSFEQCAVDGNTTTITIAEKTTFCERSDEGLTCTYRPGTAVKALKGHGIDLGQAERTDGIVTIGFPVPLEGEEGSIFEMSLPEMGAKGEQEVRAVKLEVTGEPAVTVTPGATATPEATSAPTATATQAATPAPSKEPRGTPSPIASMAPDATTGQPAEGQGAAPSSGAIPMAAVGAVGVTVIVGGAALVLRGGSGPEPAPQAAPPVQQYPQSYYGNAAYCNNYGNAYGQYPQSQYGAYQQYPGQQQ